MLRPIGTTRPGLDPGPHSTGAGGLGGRGGRESDPLQHAPKRYGPAGAIVTDKLRSYEAALRELGIGDRQTTGR